MALPSPNDDTRALESELIRIKQELLVARDAAHGANAEAGQLRGRIVELEQTIDTYKEVERNWNNLLPQHAAKAVELEELQNSSSWRLFNKLMSPYRSIRQRLG